MSLRVGCLHEKTISFLVLEGPTVDIILGRPWLNQHSPEVRWDPCEITRWSEACFHNCLSPVSKPRKDTSQAQVCSTLVESLEPLVTPSIRSDYQAFQHVFSKQAATHLPPHRPWDFAIDLLPGAKLPKGRVYPLSIPERKAMEEYIQEALQQKLIRPSTSPTTSSLFVGKKDGGLRPCIDYQALNSQTVKLPYPLPLVPAAFEELRGARIFSKLDLRSAYNLVRIRKGRQVENSFHHTIRPLRVPGDAVRPSKLTVSLPVFYERGVPGVSPSVCNSLHWRHPHLLPEPGRTLPPRDTGPPAAQRTPPLSEAGKMRVPLLHGAVPQICHQSRRYPDGPGEGYSNPAVASSAVCEGTPTISRICQLL